MPDPFNLDRFVTAQSEDYATAISEIRAGRKEPHWMWYIFSQIAGLGMSAMSQKYAIQNLEEARAYLAHPTLGPRLVRIANAAIDVDDRSATAIFGSPDDMKLRSSATLFAQISQPNSVFHQLLDKYFDGKVDEQTVRLIHPPTR